MFAIITKEIQAEFENTCEGVTSAGFPMLCGYCGRACRQMDKPEGANTMLCQGCQLAEFAATH